MKAWLRFGDWPLRAKVAALLVVASMLPLGIAAYLELRDVSNRLKDNANSVLTARADQLRDEMDEFNRGYERVATRISLSPPVIGFDQPGEKAAIAALLDVYPKSDENIWGAGIVDRFGVVKVATEKRLDGRNLARYRHVREALRGKSVISDIYLAGSVPTIAYMAPVIGADGEVTGVAILWVRAEALWDLARRANELAGPGSFAVILDRLGIRVAHTYSREITFHPAGELHPSDIREMVLENRFGERTEELLKDVRGFPEQFKRSLSINPDEHLFRGYAPVNRQWNYGVGRRLKTVHWTVFYMAPERGLQAQVAQTVRGKLLFAGGIMLVALFAGAVCAATIVRPIRALSRATEAVAGGDLSARVSTRRADELGQLGEGFNLMAERIESQAQALQRELGRSEERTQAIIESALDAIVTMDGQGLICGWNPQAETTFGWTSEEALGQVLVDLIIPEQYRENHRDGLKRYQETGEARVLNQRIELSALHKDGHEFPIELSIIPIRTTSSLVFSAFVRDITERKKAIQDLHGSREQYRTLAESLPQLVWTCQPDGWCDYVSKQWTDYTGLSAEDLLGYGWAEPVHPDDRQEASAAWKEAIERGDFLDMELRLRRRDGVYRWFKTRGVPYRDATGAIVKWIGTNTDFEDYRQAVEKLQMQLARLNLLGNITRAIGERQDLRSIFQVVIRTLEDHLPVDFCCVCLYDPTDGVLTVNSVGMQSGVLAMELALTEHSRVPIDQNGLSRCVQGQLVYEPDVLRVPFAFPMRLANGGLRSLVVAPLQVESQVFGVLVVARRAPDSFSSSDCEFLRMLSEHVALASHHAELYQALQQAYDDLRQTQQAVMQQERLRALGQMASGIAHDINNAISPVALYTESLLENEKDLSPRAREYLEIISRSIDDVAATVARMREFYRQREHQLALSPIRLSALVQEVIDLTRARWSDIPLQKGVVVSMHADLDEGLPAFMGVESEVREMLTNLIFNAVDAMPEGGTLTLKTFAREHYVGVEVSDTGIGMDEETRRQCMEPFFTTKGERGTGLGLAMVYGIVQRQKGEIEIESAVGVGTIVRITFAAVPEPNRGEFEAVSFVAPKRMRILAIDDDPLLLKALGDILEADGHLMEKASGGQAGIDLFLRSVERGEPFPVVITDLGMPAVDGRKVAAAVKEASPSTFVIMLTGWGQRLIEEGEVPAHVDYVLSKPPKRREINEALVASQQKEDHA